MFNFPSAPTVGQLFGRYSWDGEKWTIPMTTTLGDPPSSTNPLMNGVLLPGLSYTYARGDHVHPHDTSKVLPANATLTGTPSAVNASVNSLTVGGTIVATGKGHVFGNPSGNAAAAMSQADANVILYNSGTQNWAGIGSDAGGAFFIRTGLSGTPAAAFRIDQNRDTFFLNTPIAPTRPAGSNDGYAATTAFVTQNPATGAYLPLSGGTVTGLFYVNGDIQTWRAGDGAQGVIFLNSAANRYLHFANDTYNFPGSHVYTAGYRMIGNGDVGWPLINIRHAYVADQQLAPTTPLQEPYGGCIITGQSSYGFAYGNSFLLRYRQFQIQTGQGWYAVGYA